MAISPKPKTCCTPARPTSLPRLIEKPASALVSETLHSSVGIPGGAALLGTSQPDILEDGEAPLRTKRLKPFRMSPTAITNAEFAAFVDETSYVTEAEHYGWSFVFWPQIQQQIQTKARILHRVALERQSILKTRT